MRKFTGVLCAVILIFIIITPVVIGCIHNDVESEILTSVLIASVLVIGTLWGFKI